MPATGTLTPEQVAEAEQRFRNSGRISMFSLEVSLGILFGFAVLTCLGRMIIRLSTRGRLLLDDAFLLFALVCLAASTSIMYKVAPNYYLVQAMVRGDPLAIAIATPRLRQLSQHYNWTFANIVLSWSAVFGVKGSYFALFYPMMSVMSKRVVWFYWSAVVFSVLSWFALAFGSNFILCKKLGTAAVRCYFNSSKGGMFKLLAVTATLDALTDLSIVIIPIFILRKSTMQTPVKLGVATFLSLSVFMLACSIVRAAGVYHQGIIDCRWQSYWCHAEACIAVIMGSLTVYRAALVGSSGVPDKLQSYLYRVFGISTGRDEEDGEILMADGVKGGQGSEQEVTREQSDKRVALRDASRVYR
ncbi:hypothetical protein N0V90_006019 [Kalmusia sp. IMI 367209]|nr:hypothetical protein N0V90_006019 [Kalmusia sp. IMI 367209]